MTTLVQFARRDGRIPADTFAVRLAIIRAEMGWNYVQAGRACNIGPETWRLWEKRERHCTTMERTCRQIAAVTGFSFEWLMVGGALGDPTPGPDTPTLDRRNNPCYYDGAVILGPWDTPVPHVTAA